MSLLAVLVCLHASAAESADANRVEARRRFDQATKLLKAEEYDKAVAELLRADELMHTAVVQYNLGFAYAALHRPLESIEAFTRYLDEAGASIKPQRRVEVEKALDEQRDRVADLTIDVEPADAIVLLDGRTVSRGVPLKVVEGDHAIQASATDYEVSKQDVALAGRVQRSLTIKLKPIPKPVRFGQLVVHCDVDQVALSLDGDRLARTPVQGPLLAPVGQRRLVFSRPGYRQTERAVTIEEGRVETVACGVAPLSPLPASLSARLNVLPTEQDATIEVDGAEFHSGQPLVIGGHRVQVNRPGFHPFAAEIQLQPQVTKRLDAPLVPTKEYQRDYQSRAARWRGMAYISGGLGLLLGGAGLAVYIDDNSRFDRWQREQAALDEDWRRFSGTPQAKAVEARQTSNDTLINQVLGRDRAALGLGVAGGAFVVTGVALLLLGDDPNRYQHLSVGGSASDVGARFSTVF